MNDSSQHDLDGESGLEGIDLVPHLQMKGQVKDHPQGRQGSRQAHLKTAGLKFGHESDFRSLKRGPGWIQDPSSLPSSLWQVGVNPNYCQEYSLVEVILGVAGGVDLS